MIPATFDYVRAGSVDEVIDYSVSTATTPSSWRGPLPPAAHETPLGPAALLVDIGRLRELSYVTEEEDVIALGALTRHHDIATSPVTLSSVPLLAHVAGQIGDLQVRHRGTIGGSICHGDPASDLAAVLLALGATFVAQGPNGRREIDAQDFFVSFFEVALRSDELLVEIRVRDRWTLAGDSRS